MADPFIIMCAPNGARRSKTDHSKIPLTATELADCAEEILAAGASILHLHVRDNDGGHTLSVEKYREAISAIKDRVGDKLVIQVTSEAVGIYSRDQQIDMVKTLKPEAVSLALREICPDPRFDDEAYDFFCWMQNQNVFPQIILYDEEDAQRFESMRRANVFSTSKPFVLCVLGKYTDPKGRVPAPSVAVELTVFADIFNPAGVPWAACAFGENEHRLAAEVLRLGGHVRVGFENNVSSQNGGLATDNAELVGAASRVAKATGHAIASAQNVRDRFK